MVATAHHISLDIMKAYRRNHDLGGFYNDLTSERVSELFSLSLLILWTNADQQSTKDSEEIKEM